MDIRFLRAEDAQACVALAATRGWVTSVASWRQMLGLGTGYGIEVGGRLEATVVLTRFGGALATIAMMVVSPDRGRLGLGRALIQRALADTGSSTVMLYATDMGRDLYLQLGFRDVGVSHRFEGELRGPWPEAGAARAMRLQDLPAVIALDAEAQGAPRSRLVKALVDAAYRAVVLERNGTLAGFGVSSRAPGGTSSEGSVLGPLVAIDDDAALAVTNALAPAHSSRVRLDLAPGEVLLAAWSARAGLAPTASRVLMVHGGRELPGRRGWIRLLAGRAYG